MRRNAHLGAVLGLAIAACPSMASAQAVPPLGTAVSFAVLGATTVTSTGATAVNGDLGLSPGTSVTGFPPGIVSGGTIHAADAVAALAQTGASLAYADLAAQPCTTTYGVPTDIGGSTLVPGVYCFASSAAVTGNVDLDAQGIPTAVFVFKVGSTLTMASNATVSVINSGSLCNVFWQVGSAATIGANSTLRGTIIALTSITVVSGASVSPRALALNGAVTLDTNLVGGPACGVLPVELQSFSAE